MAVGASKVVLLHFYVFNYRNPRAYAPGSLNYQRLTPSKESVR